MTPLLSPLISEETLLQSQATQSDPRSVLAVSHRGGGGGGARGSSSQSCKHCGKFTHRSDQCFAKYPEKLAEFHARHATQGPGTPSQASVSAATAAAPIGAYPCCFNCCSFNLETSRMCMVGDRLDTDILFGQNTGCKTLLVLSGQKPPAPVPYLLHDAFCIQLMFHIPCVATAGCTTLSELQNASNMIQPDHYTNSVYDLVGLLQ
ncbi:hypothetical protein PR202_ga29961 [Eleusine coracana subsp. coracana]|uniref:Uncharacterized protein n=1 Tax=Eleusine coracana subsp. coracana TaxID=191504 RepID=A0AAV5DMP8_ELECO|nr:hypothetical protein PR202_ga29961 [Eleusine coracana subsp. coracana]